MLVISKLGISGASASESSSVATRGGGWLRGGGFFGIGLWLRLPDGFVRSTNVDLGASIGGPARVLAIS